MPPAWAIIKSKASRVLLGLAESQLPANRANSQSLYKPPNSSRSALCLCNPGLRQRICLAQPQLALARLGPAGPDQDHRSILFRTSLQLGIARHWPVSTWSWKALATDFNTAPHATTSAFVSLEPNMQTQVTAGLLGERWEWFAGESVC